MQDLERGSIRTRYVRCFSAAREAFACVCSIMSKLMMTLVAMRFYSTWYHICVRLLPGRYRLQSGSFAAAPGPSSSSLPTTRKKTSSRVVGLTL